MTFLSDVQHYGLDPRFALDIASVKKGIRPRGLLHVHTSQASGIYSLLTAHGLKVVAERKLEGSRDPQSREAILSDLKPNTPVGGLWHEIWFAVHDTMPIDPAELFRAPGVHLSYPKCCVDAMLATQTLSTFYDRYINDPLQRYWEINRLTTVFSGGLLTPDFFPCSLACRPARDFARPFIELAQDILGTELASDWIRRAKQPYFVYRDSLYTALNYECEDNHLVVVMESMSKMLLKNIGKTIFRHEDQFTLLPFVHFYERANDPLRITLKAKGEPLLELVAPPGVVPEVRI